MRLEDDVNFAISALSRGGQSCSNLSWMVAVVIDDRDSTRYAAQLEAAVHSAEVFERFPNLRNRDVQTNADSNRSGRVQHVVQARHVKSEFPQIGPAATHLKRDWT